MNFIAILVVCLHRNQHLALSDHGLIGASLLSRNAAEVDQRSSDTADDRTSDGASQSRAQSAQGDERSDAGDQQRCKPHQSAPYRTDRRALPSRDISIMANAL